MVTFCSSITSIIFSELKNENITKLVNNIPANKKSQDYCQWIVELNKTARAVPITDPDRETNMDVRSIIIITHYLKVWSLFKEVKSPSLLVKVD